MYTVFDPLLGGGGAYGVAGALLRFLAGGGEWREVVEAAEGSGVSAEEALRAYVYGDPAPLAERDAAATVSAPAPGHVDAPRWFPLFSFALARWVSGVEPPVWRARVVVEAPRGWRDARAERLSEVMPVTVKWRARSRPRVYISAGRASYEVPLDLAPVAEPPGGTVARIARLYNTAALTALYLAARGALDKRRAVMLAEAMIPPDVAEYVYGSPDPEARLSEVLTRAVIEAAQRQRT